MVLSDISRSLLVLVLVLAAAAGITTSAYGVPLAVEHQSASITDDDGDGIFRPGDTLRMTETLHSLDTVPLLELRGTLSTGTPQVSMPSGAVRTFPVAAPGASVSNTTPFQIALLSGYECGRDLDLGMTIMDGEPAPRAFGEQVTLPAFHISTGAEGPAVTETSEDVPKPIADASTTDSNLEVSTNGRIKQVLVKIDSITHPVTGELKLTLIAPDGTQVLLSDQRGGSGDNFTSTVFASSGSSIVGASAPFTGTYAPEGDLSALIGRETDGVWRLRAEDMSGGNIGTIDSWSLQITAATCAFGPVPALDIAPSPAQPGEMVAFSAEGSTDPTGTIAKYEWDLDGNGSFETDTGTTPTTSHTYALGAYDIGLKITSSSGSVGITHELLPVTTPPTAAFVATPSSPLSGETTELDGSGSSDSDPGGTVVKWEWDLDDDGSFETDSGADTVTASWPDAGDQVVRLRVTDNHGATDTTSQTLLIRNQAPTATLTAPQPAVVGPGNEFSAANSEDLDGTIAKYEWDLDGNGSYEQDTGSTPTATHTYGATGTVTTHLRVTDNLGDTDVDTVNVLVAQAPTATIAATPNPARPGDIVAFDASGSNDSDGAVVSYRWDFDGNGSYDTAPSVSATTTHTYLTNAIFGAVVEITDDDGATDTASVDVDVQNQLPIVSLVATPATITAGGFVGFDASGSSDPDGTITKYEWDLDGSAGFELNTGTTSMTGRSYPNGGLVIARVKVTDDTLGTKIATVAVTINPASGGGSGGAGGIGATSGLGGDTANDLKAVLGGQGTQRLKEISKSGIQLTCRATQDGTCSVALEISAKDAVKLKLAKKTNKKPVVVGRAVVNTKNGADAAIRISVSAKVKKALKKGKRVKILARASARAGGDSAATSRTVTLRK